MNDLYDKEGKPITMTQWSGLVEDYNYKVIAKSIMEDGAEVSTVWLGMDHNLFGIGPPLIFETMIFKNGNVAEESYQERYSTLKQAKLVHRKAVKYYLKTIKHDTRRLPDSTS